MSLWKLGFKLRRDSSYPQVYEDVPVVGMAARAREALSSFVEPRSNPLVGDLLACLWQEDVTVLLLARAALVRATYHGVTLLEDGSQARQNSDLLQIAAMPKLASTSSVQAHYIQELAGFIRSQTPQCPETAEARYDAVIAGLRAAMRHNMKELVQTDEIFPIDYLFDSLHICALLRATELHDVQCKMLVTAHEVIIADRDGPRIASLENLRRKLRDDLHWHSENKPTLWQMLKDPQTSKDFWPVVDLMNEVENPDNVPLLLDALHVVPDEGKAHIIGVLQYYHDARAISPLQELAKDKASRLATLAEKAIKRIMRHSKAEATQLLRASDSQVTDPESGSLLRSVEAAPDSTRPDELLRPGV